MKSIIDYLNIPKSGKIKSRIPIKEIIDNLNPNPINKKIIQSHIGQIYLEGVLDDSTLNIKIFEDKNYLYKAVYVILVNLKEDKRITSLNELLHSAFPNPVIIIYTMNDNTIISTAFKRLNKVQTEKTVIESFHSSISFNLQDKNADFINSINTQTIKANDLYEWYLNFTNSIYASRLIEYLGFFPISIPYQINLKDRIKQIENIKNVLYNLNEEYKRSSMMADKMTYHMKIKTKEKELEAIILRLKEDLANEEDGRNELRFKTN